MTKRLGAWKNAPLAYVLAEVRTEQLSDLKTYQPDLAAAFRSQFPIQRVLVTARIVATSGGAPTIEPSQENAWEFASPDNHVALILRPHGFVLHATTYKDHTDFLGRFHDALKTIAAKVPSVFVNRLGLRYIDFIIPRKDEKPESYVDSRLNPQLDIGIAHGTPTAMSLTAYPMSNGRLTLRYIRGSGKPELPPELAKNALEKSPLMKVENIAQTHPTAIIDIDRIREFTKREPLEPTVVRQEFQGMRDEISEIFKNHIATKHALKVWGAV
jgi:uncharacterized protein (TIGR04255 family)